ncbi:MAG: CAP domain-containing protein [Bacteroidales bacterium]|nr:CAP domain-containing protein [Bacteroidales bacterium]
MYKSFLLSFTTFIFIVTMYSQEKSTSYSSMKQAYDDIVNSPTIEKCEEFKRLYPESKYKDVVNRIYDSLMEVKSFYDVVRSHDLQKIKAFAEKPTLYVDNNLKQEYYQLMVRHEKISKKIVANNFFNKPVDEMLNNDSLDVITIAEIMLKKLNSIRTKYGLNQLKMDYALSLESYVHAREMCINDFFSHTDPKRGPMEERLKKTMPSNVTAFGENIALNSMSINFTFDKWLKSPGHRYNILLPSYKFAGFGVYCCGKYTVYYVNAFAN